MVKCDSYVPNHHVAMMGHCPKEEGYVRNYAMQASFLSCSSLQDEL